MRSLLPTSLTGRLVATVVALVVVTTALVAVLTAVVMSRSLNSQLDTQVEQALQRASGRYGEDGEEPPALRPAGPIRTGTTITACTSAVATRSGP